MTGPDASHGSFAEFYESHVSRVVIFLYKQGATLDDSWDSTQSAFVKLLQNWNEVRTPNAWVRKTAWHEYTTMSQRSAQLTERLRDSADVESYSELSTIKIHEEEWEVLNVIARLPERQRQVVAWYYDGFTCEEIAEVLDITPANTRANLYQARKRLRTELPKLLLGSRTHEGGAR